MSTHRTMSRSRPRRSPWVAIPRLLHRLRIKGAGRVVMAVAKAYSPLRCFPVVVDGDRVLYLDLSDPQNMPFLLAGRIPYEYYEGVFMTSIVRPGETVIDVGANNGWYSSLLAEIVGPTGRVIAFEPGARPLRGLELTASLYPQLEVISAAVGDREGEATLCSSGFSGTASIVAEDAAGCTTEGCRLTTLDAVWESKGCPEIVLVKLDVEGAEPLALSGASRLLGHGRPPAWLVEMHYDSSTGRGHHPDLISSFFADLPGRYEGKAIHSYTGELTDLHETTHIYNCIFTPHWLRDRLEAYMTAAGSPERRADAQVTRALSGE